MSEQKKIRLMIQKIFTGLIIKTVNRFPNVFHELYDELIWNESQEVDGLKHASLFEGESKWKKITVTMQIENDELVCISKSLGKSFTDKYNLNFESSYVKESCETKLIVVQDLKNSKSRYFDKVKISTTKLNYGLVFIHFEFYLKNEVNRLINNIDVSQMKGVQNFQIRRFKRDFCCYVDFLSNEAMAHRKIRENIFNVIDECKQSFIRICKSTGVSNKNRKIVTTTEFFFDSISNIQKKENISKKNTFLLKEQHYIKRKGNLLLQNTYELPAFAISKNIDDCFLKLEDDENSENYQEIVAICQIYRDEFIKKRSKINELLHKNVKIDEIYDDLLLGSEKLVKLIEINETIKNKVELLSHSRMKNNLLKFLNEIKGETLHLQSVVDKRIKTSNSLFQLSNIKSTKKLSWLVIIMTALQLVIALLNYSESFNELYKKTMLWIG